MNIHSICYKFDRRFLRQKYNMQISNFKNFYTRYFNPFLLTKIHSKIFGIHRNVKSRKRVSLRQDGTQLLSAGSSPGFLSTLYFPARSLSTDDICKQIQFLNKNSMKNGGCVPLSQIRCACH